MRLVPVVSIAVFCITGIFFLNGCGRHKVETIRISGSTTISSFIRKAIDEYGKNVPQVTFSVTSHGSLDGIDALLSDSADIAMSSAEITPEQIAAAKKKEISLKAFLLGYDVIVPIVNKANIVDNITFSQLKDVYAGTTLRWSALGGADTVIDVVDRGTTSGTHAVWHHALGDVVSDSVITTTESGSNSSVLAYVAEHANSIGYISAAYLNPDVKALNLDGMKIDHNDSLLSQYHLKRPLLLYVNEAGLTREMKSFIMYLIFNDHGKALLKEAGFFSVYSWPLEVYH